MINGFIPSFLTSRTSRNSLTRRIGWLGALLWLGILGSCSSEPPPVRATVAISNAMAGWLASGMSVTAGDEVTLFASGNLNLDGLVFEPRHALWYRIGTDGNATNFAANQETFVAAEDGQVYVALRPSGLYWSDRRGSFPDGFTDAVPVPVEFSVEAVRFSGSAEQGLATLAAAGDVSAAAALDTIATRKSLPVGFEPLWNLARSNVWANGAEDGRPGITADTNDDFGIIKMPLDLPLTETTELEFDWLYNTLPALGPETEAANHDYLSIAVEFDNGQDLTWMWSGSLLPGSHFGCPLPWWDLRETHFVLQSGKAGLGEWFSHSRNILADYQASVAGDPPTRIVGVWFIANSLFGRQRASASFSDVAIVDAGTSVEIFGTP
jgi:hypothetical protein